MDKSQETTINRVFRDRVNRYGDRICLEKRMPQGWEAATWNEYYDRARAAGLGFYELGVRKGDFIAILSENRLEWVYSDMGGLGAGACVFGIYTMVKEDEVNQIIENSGTKVIVVENSVQLEKAKFAMKNNPGLKTIVIIDDKDKRANGKEIITFAALQELGRKQHGKDPALFEKLADAVGPDDLALLQYTSGTTGVPKGAMITHGVLMANIHALDAVEPKYGYDTDNVVGFLPLSHIFERVPVHLYVMYRGITKSMAGSIETVVEDIQTKKPTIMFAVPRVLEKIYQKMQLAVSQKPPVVQKLFRWAQTVGNEVSICKEERRPIPFGLQVKHKLAYALIFKKLQLALGGRIRWMCAAGAPIAREIVTFFNGAGIFVLEGWGMSETTGGGTLSNLNDFSPGSVGRPLPGLDIKIAKDGEILVKGPGLFKGYWKMEAATKEAFTSDGYFMTGDIGRFDERGLMYITDRKKDIIITAGGKNTAPQKIETLFKEDPLFTQFVVFGDRKKYLVALVNLEPDIAARLAGKNGIKFDKPRDLLDNSAFLKIVDGIVAEKNSRLAQYETIKYYRILKDDFSKDAGELTLTLKLKRKVVAEKYMDLIESMYKEN
ncbi:MAG: AMP-dependent synthetase/ligase [Syntrophales bacterium]